VAWVLQPVEAGRRDGRQRRDEHRLADQHLLRGHAHRHQPRAGYSYGSQPIPDSEVLLNILAPGVGEQHLTFGFSKMISKTQEVSFAVMRAFSHAVKGANPLEVPGLRAPAVAAR
jgi:hypothetical protein